MERGLQTTLRLTDPALTRLETQVRKSLLETAPLEMGYREGSVALATDEIVDALASYLRTLIRASSAFDAFVFFDLRMSEAAHRGMALFVSTSWVACAATTACSSRGRRWNHTPT